MTDPVFPIDGCGPVAPHEDAPKYGGQWLLVSLEGEALDTEEFPMLEHVSLELRLGYLVIMAPGMLRLDLVPDVIEDDESVWTKARDDDDEFTVVDEGDIAAAWFSTYIDAPCRLVKRLDI